MGSENAKRHSWPSAFHTCPYSKPNITLNGIEGSDQTDNEHIKDGLWKITLTHTGVVKTEHSTIECSVTHYGGITVTATKDKNAKCVHHNISIEPELADVTEGVPKNFTCTIYHSCQNENPNITWNYENMQVTEWNKTLSGLDQISYSNIIFLGAKEDHGKKLICTATFSGRDIMAFVVLNVQSQKMQVQSQEKSISPNLECHHQRVIQNPTQIMIMKLITSTWMKATSMEMSDEKATCQNQNGFHYNIFKKINNVRLH